ncbi:MAG TPA: fatty acyl-AMP ligase [Polyangiaceae bacterium]|jgi:acyl-CoA synthetase (AMP-forming)/AMP-acid ligase II
MPATTLAAAIEEAAKCDPTHGFRFVPETTGDSSEASFSYTAIERASARYGGALQAIGLRKGDRVALILPTNEDFVLCFFGALRAGIIPVPIYPPLGLGQLQGYLDNTRHIVRKSGAKVLVTDARIKRLLGTVQASAPELEQVIAVEAIRESQEPLRAARIDGSDIAFLQFTSGSTSRPKGVTLTHDNLLANIDCFMRDGLKAGDGTDIGVSWLPLYHDMGLIGFVLAPLVTKNSTIFIPPLLFLKRPATWLQIISRHKGTISYGPNFAYALCCKRIRERELEGVDLSSWRVAGCGAEPIRPETLDAFADAFARVKFKKEALLPSYGMAESSLAVCFTELDEGMKTLSVEPDTLWSQGVAKEDSNGLRLVSCGKAFRGHDIQVFSPEDATSEKPLEEDRVGELRIKGPSVMKGYWQDEERTRDAFAGSYLKTGDLGFLHEGRVFICGRSKEVIIVNGRNYYPQDMEWEAGKVAGVRKGNVIAFGSRDPSGQEVDRERVVVAFEVQEPTTLESKTSLADLVGAVRKSIQEGMALSVDDVVPLLPGVLPKTSSGKLQRAKTRELYESGDLGDRKSARDVSRLDVVKEAAKSQLEYFKLAVLGNRKKKG